MNFVIVEGDFPFWRGFLVDEWKRLPHRTLLLSQAPSLWRRGDYDAVETLPLTGGTIDVPALRRIVGAFGPVAGALTVFEPAVGRTLELQRALGLPELSALDGRALRNKAAMVETMQRAGLAVPATVSGRQAEAVIASALERLRFPLVCKPPELAGKAGVRLVRDEAELRAGVLAALEETLPFEIDGVMTSVAGLFGCEQGVLVQEYVEGPEYSIEGYACRGTVSILAITEKLTSGPPLFEELGHLQPARLGPEPRERVIEYSIAAAEAFGLVNCFFHLELRLAPTGPVMMEINCRLSGDMIGRLLEMQSGMNVGDVLLRLAAGEQVSSPPRWVGAAGVRMATVPTGGTVRSIRPPLLRSEREAAAFDVGPGSPVHEPKPGGVTRVGYFMVAAETPDAVEKRLGSLADETVIDVSPSATPA